MLNITITEFHINKILSHSDKSWHFQQNVNTITLGRDFVLIFDIMGKHKPRTPENRMLKEILGTDGGSDWGLYKTAWCGSLQFVISGSITTILKFWKVVWVEDMKNTSKIFIRKAEGTRLFWCSKQKNIIKLSHKSKITSTSGMNL